MPRRKRSVVGAAHSLCTRPQRRPRGPEAREPDNLQVAHSYTLFTRCHLESRYSPLQPGCSTGHLLCRLATFGRPQPMPLCRLSYLLSRRVALLPPGCGGQSAAPAGGTCTRSLICSLRETSFFKSALGRCRLGHSLSRRVALLPPKVRRTRRHNRRRQARTWPCRLTHTIHTTRKFAACVDSLRLVPACGLTRASGPHLSPPVFTM